MRTNSRGYWFGGLLILSAALGGCTGEEADHSTPAVSDAVFDGEYPIHVVCTTGMVGDMVAAVGGEHVVVECMMGPGVDPHLYKPSPKDTARLTGADMVFYSGLHLEAGLIEVFVSLSEEKPVAAVTGELERSHDERLIEMDGDYHDPHVWFDPEIWADCIPEVVATLSRFDPDNASVYEANGKSYRELVLELKAYGEAKIAEVPAEQRVLVTAHDAFSYFGRCFGLELVPVQGKSTETEAGVARINEMVELIVGRSVKAVFAETSVSNTNMQALVEGCESRGHEVAFGEELYSDALGEDGTAAGDYLGMVRTNIDHISSALK